MHAASYSRGRNAADYHAPDSDQQRQIHELLPVQHIGTISPRPMLFISGDQANSREFSEDAYKRAAEPKELCWGKGAGHVDFYDRVSLIPFGTLNDFFFTKNLK